MTPRLRPYDNPGSVRVRKYVTGSHLAANDVEVGQTPSEVVWSEGPATLRRYGAHEGRRFPVPVVIVYAFILRSYILDLVPGRSLVAFLVEQGLDVYLLDWGATDADNGKDFAGLVDELLPRAVDAARGYAGSREVTLLGHCQGGTMTAIAAASRPHLVRNLVLLATPIDFAPRRPGPLGAWTLRSRQRWYDPAAFVDATGTVPAHLPTRVLDAAVAPVRGLMRATGTAEWIRARAATDEDARAWLGACRWVDDSVALPGAGFVQWIRDFYLSNDLVAGRFEAGGRRVALPNVTAEVLSVAGEGDAVVPVAQTPAARHFPGASSFARLLVDAGHVGLVVGPTARSETWRPLREWILPRSGEAGPGRGEQP